MMLGAFWCWDRLGCGAARWARHTGRLPHGCEGCRHQQLIFLPDRPHPRLGQPWAAGLTGCLTDAGPFVEVLLYLGMDEFVQPAKLADPAARQERELLPRL